MNVKHSAAQHLLDRISHVPAAPAAVCHSSCVARVVAVVAVAARIVADINGVTDTYISGSCLY
jgi:hypothetical protein